MTQWRSMLNFTEPDSSNGIRRKQEALKRLTVPPLPLSPPPIQYARCVLFCVLFAVALCSLWPAVPPPFPKITFFFFLKWRTQSFTWQTFRRALLRTHCRLSESREAFLRCAAQTTSHPSSVRNLPHAAGCATQPLLFFSAGTLRWWPVEKWPFPPKVPCDRDPEKVGRLGMRCRRAHAGCKIMHALKMSFHFSEWKGTFLHESLPFGRNTGLAFALFTVNEAV